MKTKLFVCLLAALMVATLPVAAKDKNKGTGTVLENWGTVSVPNDLYMEAGTQPVLIADTADNDMVTALARVLPGNTPQTYQLVKADQGAFQYGYMLYYRLNAYEVQTLVGTSSKGTSLASSINAALQAKLPRQYYLTEPVKAQTVNGTTFYTGAVEKRIFINQADFTETIRIIVRQGDSLADVVLVLGHDGENADLLPAVTQMLIQAKRAKK